MDSDMNSAPPRGISESVELARRACVYNEALMLMRRKNDLASYESAERLLLTIPDHADAACQAEAAARLAEEERARLALRAKKRRTIKLCAVIAALVAAAVVFIAIPFGMKAKADELLSRGLYDEAAGMYGRSLYFGAHSDRAYYEKGERLYDAGKYEQAAVSFVEAGSFGDARERASAAYRAYGDELQAMGMTRASELAYWRAGDISYARAACDSVISAGTTQTLAVRFDGKVYAAGDFALPGGNTGWSDVLSVSVGRDYALGLKRDGTVETIGDLISYIELNANEFVLVKHKTGEVMGAYTDSTDYYIDTSAWRGLIAVSAGRYHAVGLRGDGTLVTVGSDIFGQCDTEEWRDIIEASAGSTFTAGLHADGTVVTTSVAPGMAAVSEWQGIVDIAAGEDCLFGLTEAGKVLVAATVEQNDRWADVSSWENVVAISASDTHVLGLTGEGRVLAFGGNGYGQCDTEDISGVVALSAGNGYSAFVHDNGRVSTIGGNSYNKTDVGEWKLFGRGGAR